MKYNRLTLKKIVGKDRGRNNLWLCECDCGNVLIVRLSAITSGNTKSCGCLRNENRIKHGMSYSREYSIWHNMIQRCTNPNNTKYRNYGGRGIIVCAKWMDFTAFHNDIGVIPIGLTLDRIDNNGNYEPSNCRLVDIEIQNQNRRSYVLESTRR